MEDDKPKTQGPERLRTVYVVEVMEESTADRRIEIYGYPKDAKKALADWRAQGRRARSWPESVLWS